MPTQLTLDELLAAWEAEVLDGEAEIEALAKWYYATLEGLKL